MASNEVNADGAAGPAGDDAVGVGRTYDNAVALDCAPGDVIVFDSHLHHAATANQTTSHVRQSLSFRYVQAGDRTGQSCLPDYVVRSAASPERELKNPFLFFECLKAAVAHAEHSGELVIDIRDPERAARITGEWESRIRVYDDWLTLGRQRSVWSPLKRLARRVGI